MRRHGNPLEAVRADILCCFEVLDAARKYLLREFAWVTAVSARSGVLKPEQVFVTAHEAGLCSNVAQADRFSGRLLDLTTLPPLECPQYLQASNDVSTTCGRLQMFSADAFAFHLLNMFDDADSDANLRPGQVVINKLLFQDITPRRVCVVSSAPDFERILVGADATDHPRGADEEADSGCDSGQEAVAAEVSDPSLPGFDFMALFEQAEETSSATPAAPRPKRRKKEHPPAERFDADLQHASRQFGILDDPELQAILGSSDMAALKQAVVLCQESDPQTADEVARVAEMQAASDDDLLEVLEVHGADDRGQRAASSSAPPSAPASSSSSTAQASAPAPSATASSSSSTARASATAPTSSSSTTSTKQTTKRIRVEEDGSVIEAVFQGHGSSYCFVRKVKNGTDEALGEIKFLVKQSGDESLRAICKKHRGCSCWISGTAQVDMLLQWLSSAHVQTPERHAELSISLRQSIGMKVRTSRNV